MREKYVVEAIGTYFIFGEYPDGNVDVSVGTNAPQGFTHIPQDLACLIILAHADFKHRVIDILKDYP